MPVANGSFETEGATQGGAASWSVETTATMPVYAGLGGATGRPLEGFGDWFTYYDAIGQVTVEVARFLGELPVEGFLSGWFTSEYITSYTEGSWPSADLSSVSLDNFGVGWNVAPFYLDWSELTGPVSAGSVDFDSPGWVGDWANVTSSALPVEDFNWS